VLEELRHKREAQVMQREQGSVIAIQATRAPLAPTGPPGLARTGTTGGHGSSDLAIAFATANRIPHDEAPLIHQVDVLNGRHPTTDPAFYRSG
jgi:D-aminopeptidase